MPGATATEGSCAAAMTAITQCRATSHDINKRGAVANAVPSGPRRGTADRKTQGKRAAAKPLGKRADRKTQESRRLLHKADDANSSGCYEEGPRTAKRRKAGFM
jgi:hypothetical protein